MIRNPLATAAEARILRALAGLLANPAGRAPDKPGSTHDHAPTSPRGTRALLRGGPTYSAALHLSRALPLPPGCGPLLRGKEQTYRPHAPPAVDERPGVVCSEVATGDTVALDAMLRRGGFRPDVELGPSWTYVLRAAKVNRTLWQISFEPILPHGQWEAMGG